MEVVSHAGARGAAPDGAPSGDAARGSRCCSDALDDWTDAAPATARAGRALPHRGVRRAHPQPSSEPDAGSTATRPRLGDDLRGGAARRRRRDRGGRERRLRARAAARPSRARRPRDGLLPLQQRRGRGPRAQARARARARRDRRLGRPPRQRHAGDLLGRPDRPLRLAAPVAVLSGHRRAGRGQTETTLNVPLPAGSATTEYVRAFEDVVEPAVRGVRARPRARLGGLRRARRRPARRRWSVTEDGFRELARRCRGLAPRVAAVLEGGYNLETLPGLVQAALEGFS